MNAHTQSFSLHGNAGHLECKLDLPVSSMPRGVALIAHPHPLYGGSMDNKVVQTLTRAFIALGYVCARMNFRGVGESTGAHDYGMGETDDMALLHAHMVAQYPGLPVALGGFSFGTFVLSRLQQQLMAQDQAAERLVLVGCAAGKWALALVPSNTLLIHGEQDDTIPLSDVLDWARPQDLPVIVIPGADHFFHRKLHHIKQLVIAAWHAN
jgi:alpha/beta superfamily hydrolase